MQPSPLRRAGPWLLSPLLLLCSAVGCGGCANQKNDEPDRPPTQIRRGSLVEQLRGPDELEDQYRPPTTDEYLRFTQALDALYPRLFAGATEFDNLRPRLREAGFRLEVVERQDQNWIVLYEGGERWRGTGGFIFRTGPAAPVLVQAPHSYYDLHTDHIGERLFEETDARALFFNSLHRYRGASHERDRDTVHPSDLSHATSSFFHLAMIRYLRHRPETLVVQLHGFADDELADRDIGIVLSDGSSNPPPLLEDLEANLDELFDDWEIALYPEDSDVTDSYAATANAQGRWMRSNGRGQFVHLELIRQLREQMKDGEVDMTAVGRAIIDTTEHFSK